MTGQKIAPPSLHLMDFVRIAFKHKWKVIICTLLGFGAAAGFYFTNPPQYESDAKILVKYVADTNAESPTEGGSGTVSRGATDNVLNSEMEIMTSWDIYEQVANEIGPTRICPTVPDATADAAARIIAVGLTVTEAPNSDVLLVSYKSGNPTLAPEILQSLLDDYFTKHLDVHRSKIEIDMVSQESDITHAELTKAEDDLKKKKADADIISVQDTGASINAELASTEREIDTARSALAEQKALVAELTRAFGGVGVPDVEAKGTTAAPAVTGSTAITPDMSSKYNEIVVQINALEGKEDSLLATYNPESIPVQAIKSELTELRGQKDQMEKAHPGLAATSPTDSHPTDGGRAFGLEGEQAKLLSMQAGLTALESRQTAIQKHERDFAKVAPDIEDLERTVAQKQADYASAQTKLHNFTLNETLDPSKMPNISTVQKPSPAMIVAGKRQKTTLALAAGGFGVGFGLALLIELVLNQSVRRAVELEQGLAIPVWLTIPFSKVLGAKRRPALPDKSGEAAPGPDAGIAIVKANGGETAIAPWEIAHFARPYAETIRDRLGLYFEANNMTHRPKLLAIAGSGTGAGTSTLAAGIAGALSETGEGKVLLVDMNPGRTEAHPFFKGRPAHSLATALNSKGEDLTSAGENLFLATTATNGNANGSFGLKRLRELIPNIKESDFDYVLFDMPPISQTSPTAAMAAYMDTFIYLVESDKANRETVKKDYSQLTARKQDVLVILNKVQSYMPKFLEGNG
jgi:polysaccharide biosynthesis transport protein